MPTRFIVNNCNLAGRRLLIRRFLKLIYSSRCYGYKFEDIFHKPSVDFIQESSDVLMIISYGPTGFKINDGIRVIGPIALFPRTILHWNVGTSRDINEESLSLFTLLEPKLDLLIVGKGDKECEVDPNIRRYLASKRIGLELLPTDQACALLNFMISERRLVAGALIPPTSTDQDDSVRDTPWSEPGVDFEIPSGKEMDEAIDKSVDSFRQMILGKGHPDEIDSNELRFRDEYRREIMSKLEREIEKVDEKESAQKDEKELPQKDDDTKETK